ncbi:MAG: hypothetical protein R6W78_09725 [Bacteroidales bacterium]
MKKILLTIVTVIIAVITFAQTPEMLNYQAVVRNSSGELIKSTSVTFRISILQATETGTPVYTETHNASTNTQGLVNLKIGNGTTTDNFATIDWSSNVYFIKVEMDPAGGTAYAHYSTSQLLSVPYALNAKQAETVSDEAITADKIADNAVTAAKISADAVNAVKIMDEPGVAHAAATPLNNYREIPTGINSLDSIIITVPAAGYIYATGTLNAAISHTNGTKDEVYFQLSTSKNTIDFSQTGFTLVRVPAGLPTATASNANYGFPVHMTRIFTVNSAGNYVIYLNARVVVGWDASDSFINAQMTAIYFPTAYGTVFE